MLQTRREKDRNTTFYLLPPRNTWQIKLSSMSVRSKNCFFCSVHRRPFPSKLNIVGKATSNLITSPQRWMLSTGCQISTVSEWTELVFKTRSGITEGNRCGDRFIFQNLLLATKRTTLWARRHIEQWFHIRCPHCRRTVHLQAQGVR